MTEPRVGYEIDLLLVEPVEYWLYRCRHGRRVAKFGPFPSEGRVRQEIEFQESLDRDEKDRARVPPQKKEE